MRIIGTLFLLGLAFVVAPPDGAEALGDRRGAQGVAVCDGVPATLVGTTGDDVLVGTDDRDVVQALEGDDVVRGLKGDDLLCGGVGADRLDGGRGEDVVWGGSDADPATHPDQVADVIVGGPGSDVIHGGPTPNDGDGLEPSYRQDVADYSGAHGRLHADFPHVGEATVSGLGHDVLDGVHGFVGGQAGDVVEVHREFRSVVGGPGDDFLTVKAVGSTTRAGPGDDVVERGWLVRGGGGADRLVGPVRRAEGGGGPDVMVGRDDADRLLGGAGADRLSARGGDDHLDGGAGTDRLSGGPGDDTCTTGEVVLGCESG